LSDPTLEQKAVELIGHIEKLAEPAMQLTLQAIRVGAITTVCIDVVFLALVVFAWRFAIKHLYPKWRASESDSVEIGGSIAALIVGVISLVLCVICITEIFSTATWLSIIAPELQLARLLVNKAAG
jgi:hypothetical protein